MTAKVISDNYDLNDGITLDLVRILSDTILGISEWMLLLLEYDCYDFLPLDADRLYVHNATKTLESMNHGCYCWITIGR